MSGVHAATSGALTRELRDAVLAEFDEWAPFEVSQAAHFSDAATGARNAVGGVRAELMDHLQIRLAATLATFGISADGEVQL